MSAGNIAEALKMMNGSFKQTRKTVYTPRTETYAVKLADCT